MHSKVTNKRCTFWCFVLFTYAGGADSTSTATIVHCMCVLVHKAAEAEPDGTVAKDCRRICGEKDKWIPESSQDMANKIFHTSFMGMEYSSTETRDRAQRIADQIGAYHQHITIDNIVAAILFMFFSVTSLKPKFLSQGEIGRAHV